MRKIAVFLLLMSLLMMLLGCSSKTEIPDGIDNEEFFLDMVNCLKLTKRALETKNDKYIQKIDDIIASQSSTGSEAQENTLNNKEKDILFYMALVRVGLDDYCTNLAIDSLSDKKTLIDDSTIEGQNLLEYIQMTIDEMEIAYQIN